MKAKVALSLLIVTILALAGCATAPKAGPDDCLVIIMTETVNPDKVAEGLGYRFYFTGTTEPAVANSDYAQVMLREPGVILNSIHSWIVSDYRGASWKHEAKLPLPYSPGQLIIADFVFVRSYAKVGGGTTSSLAFRKITPEEKETLLGKIKADKDFARWFD